MTEFLLSKKNTSKSFKSNKIVFSNQLHLLDLQSFKTMNQTDSAARMYKRPMSYRSRIKTSFLSKKDIADEESALQSSVENKKSMLINVGNNI
jgi:hypothetical protein